MAIISASRRTDIPAFFAEWFMTRVREGYFYRINPFNTNQVSGFSLAPEDVDAIVFWTKNPGPLLPHLRKLDERGLRYYFQFTLNPYGVLFEPHVPPLIQRIVTFLDLSDRLGPRRVIWRYDPIILSDRTPVAWHLEQLAALAEALHGATDRLVISFLDFYGKVNRRLADLERSQGLKLNDIAANLHCDELRTFATGFHRIAADHGMSVFSCSEETDLVEIGIRKGSCIDGDLIRELFGAGREYRKDKYQRGACGCVSSVDMGIYNTCRYQCAYCYANMSPKLIDSNLQKHNPAGPALINNYPAPVRIIREKRHCAGADSGHSSSDQPF
jgi:DNA repair photolyase